MTNGITANNLTTNSPVPKTSATGSAGTASGIGSTFLSLLVKELQNQDPTAPMDSTAMVGQMISLNQLDQLIGINQTLGAVKGASVASNHNL